MSRISIEVLIDDDAAEARLSERGRATLDRLIADGLFGCDVLKDIKHDIDTAYEDALRRFWAKQAGQPV